MKVKPMIFNTEMVKALLGGRKTVTRRPWKGNSHKPCNVGDLLYVRETFCIGVVDEFESVLQIKGCKNYMPKQWLLAEDVCCEDVKFKPSIHMPRHASRITLKVTDVRIEKLNDLRKSDEQVKKEGFDSWPQFKYVWESIYGQSKSNDYVWVIEFEVIHKNVDKYLSSLSLPEQ